MNRNAPLIPLADYQRAFRVIYSVLESVQARTNKACIFFSVAGATLLRKFYKKQAFPVAGSAFYQINSVPRNVISLSQLDDGVPHSSIDSFHCWIYCEGYAVDFMAPIFGEALASADGSFECPRRMFQKDLSQMPMSFDDFRSAGSFYLQSNMELTQQIITSFPIASVDLVNFCLDWYTKPPKSIATSKLLGDSDGNVTNIALSTLEVVGAW